MAHIGLHDGHSWHSSVNAGCCPMSLSLRAGLPKARTHPVHSLNTFISSSPQKNRIHGFQCFSLCSGLPIVCNEKLAVCAVVFILLALCEISWAFYKIFIWLVSFAFQQLSVICSDVALSVLCLGV